MIDQVNGLFDYDSGARGDFVTKKNRPAKWRRIKKRESKNYTL